MAPPSSPAPLPAGADRGDRRDRAAERGDHASVAGADDRARDGRVAQHGREGRRPQSPDRGAGRGEELHRAAPAQCANRDRRLRRNGLAGADSDPEPGGPPRRHRPVPAAAGNRNGQRPLPRAGHTLPRCRDRSRVARVQRRTLERLAPDAQAESAAQGRDQGGKGCEARRRPARTRRASSSS